LLATLGAEGASGGSKADPPDVLAAILGAHPDWFASVVANADEHRLQILYTQIATPRTAPPSGPAPTGSPTPTSTPRAP
jgi:hypothetical protein